jgi:hypothetical protein
MVQCSRKLTASIATAIVLALASTAASAQSTGTVDPWPKVRNLKKNTTVTVTLTTGATKRGKILSASSAGLTIDESDDLSAFTSQTDIQVGQVERVTTRSFKPMVWGALIGFGATYPFAAYDAGLAYNEGGTSYAGAYLALGIGSGLGIGYALSRPKTLYTRPHSAPSPQVFVSPVILRKGGGLAMAIRF